MGSLPLHSLNFGTIFLLKKYRYDINSTIRTSLFVECKFQNVDQGLHLGPVCLNLSAGLSARIYSIFLSQQNNFSRLISQL